MFRLFRGRLTSEDLAVSIVAVRMGDRLLQIGLDRHRLLSTLAGKVGLTGRACGIDTRPTGADRAREGAAAAGVLVEIEVGPITLLPYGPEEFDIVIVTDIGKLRPEARVACLREAHRVLRPAGRCVVVEQVPRGGLAGSLGSLDERQYHSRGGAEHALRAEGFVAVRLLAARKGLAYYEAAKPRP